MSSIAIDASGSSRRSRTTTIVASLRPRPGLGALAAASRCPLAMPRRAIPSCPTPWRRAGGGSEDFVAVAPAGHLLATCATPPSFGARADSQ
eukprot:9551955-Lingulodinium_polyedra.AAC.1